MDINTVITELIRKECESYRLIPLGLLPSVKEGVRQLLPLLDPPAEQIFADMALFRLWRQETLLCFYRHLNYSDYIQKAGTDAPFCQFVLSLEKRIVARLQEQYKEDTIDKELAVPPRTLAFKLSAMLSDELLQTAFPLFKTVRMPSEVEKICRDACHVLFPINLDQLLVRLKRDDPEFWQDIYLLIKRIAELVTSGLHVSIHYKKETTQDTWSDSALLLHEKVIQDATPPFETSLHFRNYIARICQNKCREAVRRNAQPALSLDDPELVPDGLWQLLPAENDPSVVSAEIGLLDIDRNNPDEVGEALTVILWDKTEPWYSRLVAGITDKTELLFLHYVDGHSYEQIAEIRGSHLPDDEKKRLQNKLRQDAVRVRRTLKQRFLDMLEENR